MKKLVLALAILTNQLLRQLHRESGAGGLSKG
jgi:hypothetical protein